MFTYPAACDVEWELLETVTMVLVAVEGNRACKLGPYDRARCTLVYLRKHDTLEQIAAGFRIGGFDIDKGRAAAAAASGRDEPRPRVHAGLHGAADDARFAEAGGIRRRRAPADRPSGRSGCSCPMDL